ncbi:helix-turn-helix transcriptional regulator [Geobacter sp. DSM 9736]|uniref:helix-turn-helix transcriptional regulator n=1 Tax=Geobacter sp. DSM 9736 TaxID=1277350 RepID=UPI000B50F2C6|nr:helix-turn-helix transcriptional regulator [Geobacter sp. DSM 9736]SNB46311.1 regulatory protein, luxR family [Geobacter sp. DSM 9736]
MSQREIFIVGCNPAQNQLLASFLSRKTGYTCTTASTIHDVPPTRPDRKGRLLLLDCFNLSHDHIIELFVREALHAHPHKKLALFNVCPGIGAETETVMAAVREIFYVGDSISTLVSGIREIVAERATAAREMPRNDSRISLTRRERHILSLLAGGYSKKEISDQLFVGLPVVKTHVGRIFRKIRVTSRLQAARWAELYLDSAGDSLDEDPSSAASGNSFQRRDGSQDRMILT